MTQPPRQPEPPSAQIAASIYLEPGFYLVELVPKGPLVAALVTHNEADGWFAVEKGVSSWQSR
jgi:hypothetical protein